MAEQTSLTDEEKRANLRKLEKQRDELEMVSNALAAAVARLPGLLRSIDETVGVLNEVLPPKRKPAKARAKSIAEDPAGAAADLAEPGAEL